MAKLTFGERLSFGECFTSLMAKEKTNGDIGSFESEFQHLAKIVERLEGGNIPLEEMLTLYEEGTLLAANLSATLKKAELKVRTLSKVHEELVSFETSEFNEE
jgi:exodeoxyribonuclease VII small subunit